MTSDKILQLLKEKHHQDIFIPECTNGSPDYGSLRLDAWVLKKGWTNAGVMAYEIKISRSDFVGDNKWQNYLEYCNEFYFVTPWGLISPDELPAEAGLMWVSKTGTRLFVKKKAHRRTNTIPESIYRYILMHRVKIKNEDGVKQNAAEHWKNWLELRKENKELGGMVSRRIREIIRDRVEKAEKENYDLQEKMRRYDSIRQIITEFREDPERPNWVQFRLKKKLDALDGIVPLSLRTDIDNVIDKLTKLRAELP